jgi:hypothetical protein
LFGVTQDSDVCIVCNDDDLPALFCTAKHRDESRIDKFTIKVVFGLVNDKGPIAIRGQNQREQYRLLLAKR